jgi:hypothetical protein
MRTCAKLPIVALLAGTPAALAHGGGQSEQAGHHGHHNHGETAPGLYPLPGGSNHGHGFDHGTPIYENLTPTGFRYTLYDVMIADDLHMVSGGDMIAFSFMYAGSSLFCAGFWNGNATIRFYENNASNTLLPSGGTLIATFNVPIQGDGSATYLKHVDLPNPVTLPQHIWMGISFDFGVLGGSGAVTAAAVPTVGSSLDAHFTGSAGYATNPHAFAHANYAFGVYIPAPGALGLLGLAGLAALRRRR